jgi:osmotically-inducible protein OsmY
MSKDTQLQEAVQAELRWEPSVDGAHIGVVAREGVVTLTGHVETYAEKHAAEAAAQRVKGVKAVVEEIDVRLPVETRRGDDEIAAAVLERLAWDVALPTDAVQVKVEDGWVALSGAVDWQYQRAAAEHHVRGLRGVVGITNEISIKPKVDVTNLSDDIVHALHRSWFFDPQTIFVTADGGKVRLAGSVRSPQERQLAAATAWGAPGVTAVENRLTIE